MANLTGKAISEFPEVTTLSDTNVFPVSSGGTKKITWLSIKNRIVAELLNVLTVARGGTGASTATGARTNLGVEAQFTYVTVLANSQSTFSFDTIASYVFFLSGNHVTKRRILIVFSDQNGTPYMTDTYTGSATGVSVSISGSALVINNQTAAATFVEIMTCGSNKAVPTMT